MAKKSDLSDDDKAIFRDAMRGVKRLSHTKVTTSPKKTQVRHRLRENETHNDDGFIFSDYEKLDPVSSEDLLQYACNGLQHKILRNLRRGQYNIEATLDLHGMTVDEAKSSLSQFLAICKRNGIRHVLMIHGKGRSHSKPILKNKLNHWLRQTNDVLAFCSALAKDGSSGALYVLLRR
jgi:DNA-nicking Smr family endonuclease